MLDKGYNVDNARNSLEQSASQRVDDVEDLRLGKQFKHGYTFGEKFNIKKTEKPESWHLIDIRQNDETTMEEAVFTIQGILVSKDLPPLQEKPKISAHRFKYLRQRVVLTGLGSSTFTSALKAAGEVYGCFDRQFSEGILESWTSSEEESFGFPCFDISNRYFTPAKEAVNSQEVAFPKGVDPRGILLGMSNGDGNCSYVHTEDNLVQYFLSGRDKNGSLKFQLCEPQIFRNGDIVQAQLSFVVIPLKGGRRKMLAVLRSLALLDRSFGQLKTNLKQKSMSLEAKKSMILKRKVGYGEMIQIDEEEEARSEKRHKMDIDASTMPSSSSST